MGGYGSGPSSPRYRLVEQSNSLAIGSLATANLLRRGARWKGGWQWQTGDPKRPITSIDLEVDLTDPAPEYRLLYTLTSSGEQVEQHAALMSTAPRYGGVRWWFACPYCRRRCGKLYLPPGGSRRFACRRCHNLRYATQREDPGERLYRRARRLVRRLGGNVEETLSGSAVIWKPRGMHQRTFSRFYAAYQDTLTERDAWFAAAIVHRFGPHLERL